MFLVWVARQLQWPDMCMSYAYPYTQINQLCTNLVRDLCMSYAYPYTQINQLCTNLVRDHTWPVHGARLETWPVMCVLTGKSWKLHVQCKGLNWLFFKLHFEFEYCNFSHQTERFVCVHIILDFPEKTECRVWVWGWTPFWVIFWVWIRVGSPSDTVRLYLKMIVIHFLDMLCNNLWVHMCVWDILFLLFPPYDNMSKNDDQDSRMPSNPPTLSLSLSDSQTHTKMYVMCCHVDHT